MGYRVTVTYTRVEIWEVEASSPEEAALNYESGEKVSEDTHREVSEVWEIPIRKCKECGTTKNLVKINEKPEYVCKTCWDKKGYEYDPTPWW